MYPKIWIIDSYDLMMLIGVALAFLLVKLQCKSWNLKKGFYYSILINACITIAAGILLSGVTQWIFNLLNGKKEFSGMTFYGGLLGGAAVFILIYIIKMKKEYPEYSFLNIMYIAAPSITIAHSLGRIGCFLAGCCYGIETDSPLGVTFPGMDTKVYPTQLFEAIFLMVLTIVLLYLSYRKKFKYTLPLYMISYGIWRFFIEFIRGDYRGGLDIFLSPAQVISILIVAGGIVLFFIMIKWVRSWEAKGLNL